MSAINQIWGSPFLGTSSTPANLQNAHNQAANQYATLPQQSTSATNIYAVGGGSSIGTGQHTWVHPHAHPLMSKDLDDPVFDMPLEALRAAWLACFGSSWIGLEQVQEHTMRLIYTRLFAMGEVEQITVMDSYTPKARLIKREAKCET